MSNLAPLTNVAGRLTETSANDFVLAAGAPTRHTVSTGVTAVIPDGYQVVVAGRFTVLGSGELQVLGDGELVVL